MTHGEPQAEGRAAQPADGAGGGGLASAPRLIGAALDRQFHVHDSAVIRRRFLYGYFAATFTVWCVMVVTQFCFEWQNTHQIPNMGLRDVCIAIWFVSSFGVIVLQLVCIAMMAFPPRFIGDHLTARSRIAVASFAVIVLLTNPWAAILLVVMRGGTLG